MQATDGKGTVTGDLTFHGVTKPVTLDVAYAGASATGSHRSARGWAFREARDQGTPTSVVTNSILSQYAGDDVEVIFEVEFEKK